MTCTKTPLRDISLIIQMASKWYKGADRIEWRRPCVQGMELVVFGDSQAKIFGREQIIYPRVSITSFSGCDVRYSFGFLLNINIL